MGAAARPETSTSSAGRSAPLLEGGGPRACGREPAPITALDLGTAGPRSALRVGRQHGDPSARVRSAIGAVRRGDLRSRRRGGVAAALRGDRRRRPLPGRRRASSTAAPRATRQSRALSRAACALGRAARRNESAGRRTEAAAPRSCARSPDARGTPCARRCAYRDRDARPRRGRVRECRRASAAGAPRCERPGRRRTCVDRAAERSTTSSPVPAGRSAGSAPPTRARARRCARRRRLRSPSNGASAPSGAPPVRAGACWCSGSSARTCPT